MSTFAERRAAVMSGMGGMIRVPTVRDQEDGDDSQPQARVAPPPPPPRFEFPPITKPAPKFEKKKRDYPSKKATGTEGCPEFHQWLQAACP
jgi:hypothetical protein